MDKHRGICFMFQNHPVQTLKQYFSRLKYYLQVSFSQMSAAAESWHFTLFASHQGSASFMDASRTHDTPRSQTRDFSHGAASSIHITIPQSISLAPNPTGGGNTGGSKWMPADAERTPDLREPKSSLMGSNLLALCFGGRQLLYWTVSMAALRSGGDPVFPQAVPPINILKKRDWDKRQLVPHSQDMQKHKRSKRTVSHQW